jgi:hypothetical protein
MRGTTSAVGRRTMPASGILPWPMRRCEDGRLWVSAAVADHHPLIGFDAEQIYAKPHDKNYGSQPHFLAWLMLAMGHFTSYTIVDESGDLPAPSIIDLDAPASIVPNVARVWNWRPQNAKQFMLDMAEGKLVTERLADAVIAKIRLRDRERRAPIARGTRSEILAKTNGHCIYCGVKLTRQNGLPTSFHTDHLFPVSGGGTDDPALLVPACAACNLKKGAKTFMEFTRDNQ